MNKYEISALILKAIVFLLIGIIFWLLTPDAGLTLYLILILSASGWFIYEIKRKKQNVKKALMLGLFLMIFDFIVENMGFFSGFWTSPNSFLSVISVPIEIMILTIIGGSAWAMHLPEKFNRTFMVFETMIFSFFGALGEYLLILNGMMIYTNGWTSVHAFFGYAITWIILFNVWYRIIR